MSATDDLVTRAATEALERLTRIVSAGAYSPPPQLRETIAALCGAIARADCERPEPDDGLDLAAGSR